MTYPNSTRRPAASDQFGRPQALISFALSAAIFVAACSGSVWPPRARSVWPPLDTIQLTARFTISIGGTIHAGGAGGRGATGGRSGGGGGGSGGWIGLDAPSVTLNSGTTLSANGGGGGGVGYIMVYSDEFLYNGSPVIESPPLIQNP